MSDHELILLFIKAPAKGQVKSRLAAHLGDDLALELYQCFVLDTLDAIIQTGKPYCICVHPPDSLPAVAALLGQHHCFMPQDGRDLGERMLNAFRVIFDRGSSRAVLIGSDTPDIPPGLFHEAFSALDTNDAVIGPALDGGYYLIGFKKETFLPELFHNIPWSTNTVFYQTKLSFQNAGYRLHSLPHWRDIDTADDLRALIRNAAGTSFASSHTMRYWGALKKI